MFVRVALSCFLEGFFGGGGKVESSTRARKEP